VWIGIFLIEIKMGRIQILSDTVANQIAAGEVVERPVSVSKELSENSLDAGATQIDVTIQESPAHSLSVTDDGMGMDAEDAKRCFLRHATSKLSSLEDLQTIASFGFRGEALASIGSVSKLRLITREKSAPEAIQIDVEGGAIGNVVSAGFGFGTRIEVRDLFFNVPARRKFLKSDRSEMSAIQQLVESLALANGDVGFRLMLGQKVLFNSPKSASQLVRAVACLGDDTEGNLFSFEHESNSIRVSGFFASPLISRKDSKGVKFFVNHRVIDDRKLQQAVRLAYRTLLEVGRFPVCAVHVELPADMVDVNAHPQKLEVRFLNGDAVFGAVMRGLNEVLSKTPWLRRSPLPKVGEGKEQNIGS
jgi:DNA mismatch repair protein MutL